MRELKKILKLDGSRKDNELKKLALQLGASLEGYGERAGIGEDILIQRIQQAYIIQIARRNWIIAVISSIASVFSALAAWIAIVSKN